MTEVVEVLAALERKEGELLRELETIAHKIEKLRSDFSDMQAVAIFHRQDVEAADFMPHMSVRAQFRRNEILTYCRDALAAVGGSLDTRQLAVIVAERKGLDVHDGRLRKKIGRSVQQAMKTARRHKIVIDEGRRLGVRVWRLAPPASRVRI